MTDEEKAKAKEQAKRFFAAAEPLLVPSRPARPDKDHPRRSRSLPKWIYLRHYISGTPYYRAQVTTRHVSKHVGSFATVAEATRYLEQWMKKRNLLIANNDDSA